MKIRLLIISAFALVLAACTSGTKDTAFSLDDDLIVLGMDVTSYPEQSEDGEIPDEEWEDFSYESKFYIVDARSGERLSDRSYKHLSSFSEGLAIASDGQGFYYVDRSGKQVIPETFRAASFFANGRAWVLDASNELWVIDNSGEKIFTVGNARDVSIFNEGKTVVNTRDGFTEVYDKDGVLLMGVEAGSGSFVLSGLLPVIRDSGMGLVDMQGQVVLDAVYLSIGPTQWVDVPAFYQGITSEAFVVGGEDGSGVMGPGGREMLPLRFVDVMLDSGLIYARDEDHVMWYDYDGSKHIEGAYEEAWPFGDGKYAAVCDDGLWGFVDREGAWKIYPQWTYVASSFDANGLAIVHDNETMMAGLIDEDASPVLPLDYSFILRIGSSDRYLLGNKEKYGVADASGKVIIEPDEYNLINTACDYSHYTIHRETK